MSLFYSRILPRISHYIQSSGLLGSNRLSSFLMTLTVLKSTTQIVCRMWLSWDLSDVLLIFRLDKGFGETEHEVKWHSQHTMSAVFVSFLHPTVTPPAPFYSTLFGRKSPFPTLSYWVESYNWAIIIITALLEYNSHTLQLIYLKCTIQWFSMLLSELCKHHHNQF